MKYKLLCVDDKSQSTTNIGDYIQALAASQFLPSIDGFVNREHLKDYDGDACKIIMNGWFMHNPYQWPPSGNINPLFVALHFNTTALDSLLSEDSISYLKQFEPIGCRDTQTMEMLNKKGVDAYFSGCLTLTLGLNYHSKITTNKIYFVDPYFITNWSLKMILKNCYYLLLNYSSISKISKKYPESKTGLRKKMIITTFFREYSKLFSKKTLVDADYICQQNESYKNRFETEMDRLKEAERLVKLYSEARLVVTSRIHCALPCLGVNTPVIFVDNAQQSEASACRFGGLIDFFNVLTWNEDHLENNQKISTFDLDKIRNKDNYKKFADLLIARCKKWVID